MTGPVVTAAWIEPGRERHTLPAYPDVKAFYEAVPGTEQSGESDYGVWWKDDAGGVWRISWVHASGTVYAVRASAVRGSVSAGSLKVWTEFQVGAVVILGNIGPAESTGPGPIEHTEPLRQILPDWAERCGEAGSLAWAAGRIREASRQRRAPA